MQHNLKQMIAIVIAYINHRTSQTIEINMYQFDNPLNLIKLNNAYSIAIQWFNNNGGEIKMI